MARVPPEIELWPETSHAVKAWNNRDHQKWDAPSGSAKVASRVEDHTCEGLATIAPPVKPNQARDDIVNKPLSFTAHARSKAS